MRAWRRIASWLWLGLCIGLPLSGFSLGPHEVVVVVNERSARSIAVAKTYARMRDIPSINLVRLALPWKEGQVPLRISPEDFTQFIWKPARQEVQSRRLEPQILAWVYSIDFPVAVGTNPTVSLTGLTFLRNHMPSRVEADDVKYASPLFAGPSPGDVMREPQSFDVCRDGLGPYMPLPAMMLGFAGERGNSPDVILAGLERARQADATYPRGTVYFVTNSDIRSTCRQWQFEEVVRELGTLQVRAVVTNAVPSGADDLMGVMMGIADVQPFAPGTVFRPGCMAEHLTSSGAVFGDPRQTKISAWVSAGASLTAGAVVEPRSIWQKFPHARFFVHYAGGATGIESFYQSVRCPLQLLMLGDPLVAPWKSSDGLMAFDNLPSVIRHDQPFSVVPRVEKTARKYDRMMYLMDGVRVGEGPHLTWPAGSLPEGPHTLRVVAYGDGLVRPQIFGEFRFQVTGAQP